MTTVVRWNPVRDIAAMHNAVDRIFNDTWRSNWRNWHQLSENGELDGTPLALDAYETDNSYTIVASLPGAQADAIDVKLHDGVLTIQAEVPAQTVAENARTLLQERYSGKFVRRIRLPQPVNVGAIDASYHDGVLTLNVPKAEEAQPRLIPVKINGSK